jgi:hypothetical protein
MADHKRRDGQQQEKKDLTLARITDRAHIIETGAESYRFRRTLEKRKSRTSAASISTAPPLAAGEKGS